MPRIYILDFVLGYSRMTLYVLKTASKSMSLYIYGGFPQNDLVRENLHLSKYIGVYQEFVGDGS